jgi:hypothetical protein
MDDFSSPCTGDVVAGDTIRFSEGVFGGSFRRSQFLGERLVEARVIRESYGADRQQHTFTLGVLASSGVEPLAAGTTIRRKGRNVYRNGTWRQPWPDEAARRLVASEKHARGDVARAVRQARREEYDGY